MNLLSKFGNVQVDNTKRISIDDTEFLENTRTEYLKVLDANMKVYHSIQNITDDTEKLRTPSTQMFHTYVVNTKDMLGDIKKEISNLHYIFVSTCVSHFRKKYNIDIEIDKNYIINGKKLGKLYTHRWNHFIYRSDDRFVWGDIKDMRIETNDIVDFIFTQIDSKSLNEVAIYESKQYMIDWYKSDSVDDIVIAKNGVMTLDFFLVNPTQHYTTKSSLKTIRSLITCIDKFCESEGSRKDDRLTQKNLHDFLGIGTASSMTQPSTTYQKFEMDGLITYLQQFKNNKMKIKFSSSIYAYKFLEFVGLSR